MHGRKNRQPLQEIQGFLPTSFIAHPRHGKLWGMEHCQQLGTQLGQQQWNQCRCSGVSSVHLPMGASMATKNQQGTMGKKPLSFQGPASCRCPEICEEESLGEDETSWGWAGHET